MQLLIQRETHINNDDGDLETGELQRKRWRMTKRPLAKALIAAQREVADIVMEPQIKDAAGASWATVAVGKKKEEK